MALLSLFKEFAAGMVDYITRHNSNYAAIETAVNSLNSMVTGQIAGVLQVPDGLQEIFDRAGIIGIDSFDFTEGAKTGPNYNFVVSVGAYYDGVATFYRKTSTTTLSMAGKASGTYYLNLDNTGTPIVGDSPGSDCVRQFSWNGSTIADKELYSGCAILFDGDDYAGMLESTARGKTFTKVADRLEEIEQFVDEAVQELTPAGTISIDWTLGRNARVLLDRATTTFNFSGGYDGQRLTLEVVQDGDGGREIAFGAMVEDGLDFSFPVPLSSDGNKIDYLGFIYNAGTGKYYYTSLARGY